MATAGSSHDDDKTYWEGKKLEWEAKKLEAEAVDLSTAFWQKPTFWFSGVPALAAVVGIGLQWYASALDYKKADVLREQAKLEAAQAKEEVDKAKKELAEQQAKINDLKNITSELDETREARNKEIASLTEKISLLKNEKSLRQDQLAQLEQSLQALHTRQGEVNTKAQQQTRLVTQLGSKE